MAVHKNPGNFANGRPVHWFGRIPPRRYHAHVTHCSCHRRRAADCSRDGRAGGRARAADAGHDRSSNRSGLLGAPSSSLLAPPPSLAALWLVPRPSLGLAASSPPPLLALSKASSRKGRFPKGTRPFFYACEGSVAQAACRSSSLRTRSGFLARAKPHSVAIPNFGTYSRASAMRCFVPSTPSEACTRPR